MKLYGSLQSRMMEASRPKTPEVGGGVTICLWTDRHAGTVRKVSPDGKKLWFTMDEATVVPQKGGYSNTYTYRTRTEVPEERWSLATLRKDGKWHEGNGLKGRVVCVGFREEYYDHGF